MIRRPRAGPARRGRPRSRRARAFTAGKLLLLGFVATFWVVMFLDAGVMFDNGQRSLWIHAPTVVAVGEPFVITVEAWDAYERVAGSYTGALSFSLESYAAGSNATLLPVGGILTVASNGSRFNSNFNGAGLVPAHTVPGADNGRKAYAASIGTPGVHYIRATDVDKGETFRSNPVVVVPATPAFDRVFWGDIHFHSALSDGSGTPDQLYTYARDVALVDFAALTDHAEMFPRFGDAALGTSFQDYVDTTNRFNEAGRFATLVALEWTPLLATAREYLCTQHMNFYMSGDSIPYISTFDQPTPYEAYEAVRAATSDPFVAWTHHVTRADYPSDFGFHDASINTMIEIYSCHGSGEFQGALNLYPMVHGIDESHQGYSVNDALRMGRRFGIMASSDSHDGNPGHDLLHTSARTLTQQPYTFSAYRYGVVQPGGLTGVLAANLSRASVFGALQARAALATTWINRPFVNFSINGVRVGRQDSTVPLAAPSTPRFVNVVVAVDGLARSAGTTNKITNVTIFKNSAPWRSIAPGSPMVNWTVVDDAPATGTSYDHCVQKADGLWYVHEHSLSPVDPAVLNTGGADYYYVRATDTLGGAAWMGPIWASP
ncbi:MAG: hypothetical protein JW839_22145 [Candidatus Lokiarchaeota archaeon]|nr:hypothetical protein [Candidatus Lokiarchaeota archaeon]